MTVWMPSCGIIAPTKTHKCRKSPRTAQQHAKIRAKRRLRRKTRFIPSSQRGKEMLRIRLLEAANRT